MEPITESYLTVRDWSIPKIMSLIAGSGMAFFSLLTIDHYFAANFPESIFEGSFCDISSFFNCDSSAFSNISAIFDVPLGYFGFVVGVLVFLGALFPSMEFEKTNRIIALVNALGVVALALYSVLVLGSLCLLCSGFYLFSLFSVYLFWRYSSPDASFSERWLQFSPKIAAVVALLGLMGAYGMNRYHHAREGAQSGSLLDDIVEQYQNLEPVPVPSTLSPFWSVRSTEVFDEAPIHIVEYADPLCSDCAFLFNQMKDLKKEFAGQINVAFQFFPLEAACNDVVEKDKHPGACELSFMLAGDSTRFVEMHDEVFSNMDAAKTPEWRESFGRKYGVLEAREDSTVIAQVERIIETGREYQKTSDEYSFGIRSTPTMIINGKMIIGTLPQEQLRAIFRFLVESQIDSGPSRFLENWE